MRKKLLLNMGNWSVVSFILFQDCVDRKGYFNRSDLMSYEHISFAEVLVQILGHKENQKYPENTLQRTIQNLRDDGYIDFLGQGRYKLTEPGLRKLDEIKDHFDYDKLWDAEL